MKKSIIVKLFVPCLLLMVSLSVHADRVSVVGLTTERLDNPSGIDVRTPRFAWKIESERRNVVQLAYHILVASSEEKLRRNEGDLWDSGEIKSSEQLWIAYRGRRLTSHMHAYWKVKVITNVGKSDWSKTASFGIAMLGETYWKGLWIGLEELQEGEAKGFHTRLHARYLRKEFVMKAAVRRATAYVAGIGLHEFYVNGQRQGGKNVLQPVPSDYRKTIYYNTYDVTDALTGGMSAGKATLGIVLGAGRYFPMRQEKYYKSHVFGMPKCRLNVVVEYADGSRDTWMTDASWRVTTSGPIRSCNEYDGEEYDARMELGAWAVNGYDDSMWKKVERCIIPDGTLSAQMTVGMQEERLGNALVVTKGVKPHSHICDFGQNIAGYVGVRMYGQKGDTIRIKYAEKLKADGDLYTDNYRNAFSEDIYVCNGMENGREWHATFVYHGFRYARITGPARLSATDVTAYAVSDGMHTLGDLTVNTPFAGFTCSDTTLNKVVKNAWWGIRDNYKGMPVDCPQRNERQPWLGDRTVGALGESFLFDNERLYVKWMRDICESQRSDGCIPDVAPAFWNYYTDNVTWPAALPFICDFLYTQYGNKQPLVDAYPVVKKWINHLLEDFSDNHIITKDKYGDWCVPPEKLDLIHSKDSSRQTDGSLISTVYMIRCMQLAEKFARLQSMETEAEQWKQRRETMTRAFNDRFLTVKWGTSRRPGHTLYPDSVFYGNNTATANLLPLAFDIVPENLKQEVVKNLVTNIMVVGDGHLTCGVIGISWLMRVLSDNGFADVAYLLATNKTYPSWGYMAENGATTIWELWNGDKADPKMNSGNHVMLLGDLLTWCYQYLGGIRQGEGVGYKHIVLRPDFSIQNCFHAQVAIETPYGRVGSSWEKKNNVVTWNVTIPPNTTADICLPDGRVERIGSGIYTFTSKIPMKDRRIVADEFVYDEAAFPQAHAATIAEMGNGDLVAAYFGGTKERNPDVCIYVSRKPKGSSQWSAPILAADGVIEPGTAGALLAGIDETSTNASRGPVKKHQEWNYSFLTGKSEKQTDTRLRRKACWNPVISVMPDGELWLFFKIGSKVSDWTGWVVKSRDGGKSWGDKEPLPKGFIGPVKNKPEIIADRLLCVSSTEDGENGWKFHAEIYDLKTKQWKYVGPVNGKLAYFTEDMDIATTDIMKPIVKKDAKKRSIGCIQPSILKLKDGRLQVLMRTRNGRLATSYSSDNGDTWSEVELTDLPSNQSGTDAVTLKDGTHVLIYNNFETLPGTKKGVRTPVGLALSSDGKHWEYVLTLEDSPVGQYSYPAIVEGKDGTLHCIYTWRRAKVKYQRVDLKR